MEKSLKIFSFGALRVGTPFCTVAYPEVCYIKIKPSKDSDHNAQWKVGRKTFTKHFDDARDVHKLFASKKRPPKLRKNPKGKKKL